MAEYDLLPEYQGPRIGGGCTTARRDVPRPTPAERAKHRYACRRHAINRALTRYNLPPVWVLKIADCIRHGKLHKIRDDPKHPHREHYAAVIDLGAVVVVWDRNLDSVVTVMDGGWIGSAS